MFKLMIMFHIAAINNAIIGRDTLIASKVFISDHNHGIFSKSFLVKPDSVMEVQRQEFKNR